MRFMTYQGSLNAAVFLVFLNHLIREAPRKTLLIADRLSAHQTAEVSAWMEAHKDQIEVFYLPPYCPEMNPVEYLNQDLKGEVNKAGLPGNQGILRTLMMAFMDNLMNVPRHVISYFLNPHVQYASAVEI